MWLNQQSVKLRSLDYVGSIPTSGTFCSLENFPYICFMDSTQITDLQIYQQVVNNMVQILDGEAAIVEASRTVSEANITLLNTTLQNALDAMNDILNPLV
jgi:hypothetical protein